MQNGHAETSILIYAFQDTATTAAELDPRHNERVCIYSCMAFVKIHTAAATMPKTRNKYTARYFTHSRRYNNCVCVAYVCMYVCVCFCLHYKSVNILHKFPPGAVS